MRRPILILGAVAAVLGVPTVASATPTIVDGYLSPTGWNGTDRVDATWTVRDASPALAGVRIELNAASDGSADGAWTSIATVFAPAETGIAPSIPLTRREGRYAARMVAWDGTGQAVRYLGTLTLDLTGPRALHATVTRQEPDGSLYAWVQESGGLAPTLTPATIEVQESGALAPNGAWISRPVTLRDGPMTWWVSGLGLAEGPHEVRLRATDAAGNTSVEALPWLWVDRTPPAVADVRVLTAPSAARPRVELGYRVEEGGGLPTGGVARVVDLGASSVVGEGPAARWLPQTIAADLPAARRYDLAIEVTDAAGNVGRSAPIAVTVPGTGPPAEPSLLGALSVRDPMSAALQGTRLEVTAPGAMAQPNGREPLRTIRYREAVVLTGRLTGRDGTPMAGLEVEARDPKQVTVGVARTGPDGRFTITARPIRSGALSVGVPAGDGLLPAQPRPAVQIQLRPVVTLRASGTSARAGGAPVTFTVTVGPTPGALGLPAKNIVLEWRDPFRGAWRPVINGRVGADGRARFRWAFNAGGFTVPVRARLPAEPGWPTRPALSRAITVKVT